MDAKLITVLLCCAALSALQLMFYLLKDYVDHPGLLPVCFVSILIGSVAYVAYRIGQLQAADEGMYYLLIISLM